MNTETCRSKGCLAIEAVYEVRFGETRSDLAGQKSTFSNRVDENMPARSRVFFER